MTHGRYSKVLKSERLKAMYEAAKGDDRLIELDEEAAIIQTLIFDQIESVNFHALDFKKLEALTGELRESLRAIPIDDPQPVESEAPIDILAQGKLGDYAVLRPRLCTRGGVYFLACRYWYEPAKLAGINYLSAAKDSLDEEAAELIAADLIKIASGAIETFEGIVTAPSPRHSAFLGVPHFAARLAELVAEGTGNDYASFFEPIPAKWIGHHPRREKDPPKLKEGAAAELEGKRVLLIDDVATSATTLELHAKALRAAGAKVNSIVWVYGSTKGTQGR